MRHKKSGSVLLYGLIPIVLLFLNGSAWSEELDVEYAEDLPLATESLLLDITQTDSGRFIAVGERGHVVLSDDGESWRQAKVVPTRSTLTSIAVAGGRLWAGGHDTVIITSGDDGETWSLQYFDPERQQPIMDVHFFDSQSGVVMGAYGLMMTTEDGGLDWQDGLVDPEVDYHLNDLVVVDGNRHIIAGEAGYSYRSLDGGDTWQPLDLPYQGSMWGGLSVEDDCVLLFGLRGHVLQTCDFGENWYLVDTGTQASVSGGTFDGERTVLVGNSGSVLVRQGSGPFEVNIHSSGVDFSSIMEGPSGRYLLVGEDGVHYFPELPARAVTKDGEGEQ